MTNKIKADIDSRLRDMDWHGEAEVLIAIRGRRSPARRARVRTAIIACVLTLLLAGTAFAVYALQYSQRMDRQADARAALRDKYGLTEDILDMFVETHAGDGESWTTCYELPVYGEQAGVYTVICGNGVTEVGWTHDGRERGDDDDLSGEIWGAAQLEKMRLLYRSRAEMIASADELGDYDSLSMEEKAAIDAPLLELPARTCYVNILPGEDDLQIDEAQALARAAVMEKYAVAAEELDACSLEIAFRLAGDVRTYDIRFKSDGAVRYRVALTSPGAEVIRCEGGSAWDGARLSSSSEDEIEEWEMTVEERAAYHERMRLDGGEIERWNSVLPEAGELDEARAVAIAEAALLQRFGLTRDALQAMETQVYCRMNYHLYDEPVKVWWIRYVNHIYDYQVTLRAADGTVEEVYGGDPTFGVG